MCEETLLGFMRPLVSPGCRVAVALSGGSDSMALLGLLEACRERLGIAGIGIAHVDHGLRGEESSRERRFVEQVAARTGSPLHVLRLEGRRIAEAGIEQWARTERYRFFAQLRAQHGYRWVATGHTLEDQAETVLLRLLRGTGIVGLVGIRPVRDDGIIRPLLQFDRPTLQAWLRERGWGWCTDSSNSDLRFRRNWVRHVLLPRLRAADPAAVARLAAVAEAARGLEPALGPWVNKWLGDAVLYQDENMVLLTKPFAAFPAREAVAHLWRRMGIPYDRAHLEDFFCNSARTHGEFLLPEGWSYYPSRDRVEIVRGGAEQEWTDDEQWVLAVPGETVCTRRGWRFVASVSLRDECRPLFDEANRTAWLDRDLTGDRLIYRRVRGDDRFVPLGAQMSVRVIAYLKKRGIPKRMRESSGVVTGRGGEIVWVPCVAAGEKFRIRRETERMVRISCGGKA